MMTRELKLRRIRVYKNGDEWRVEGPTRLGFFDRRVESWEEGMRIARLMEDELRGEVGVCLITQ